jgi:D-serine deaminase-like pyridoxal phosphate-dependent protein
MSVSPARALAVVDAGLKAVALDSGPPLVDPSWSRRPLQPAAPSAATAAGGAAATANAAAPIRPEYKCAGDEHGLLMYPHAGAVPQLGPAGDYLPPRGTLLRLQPGHCDPTVNLYDYVVGCRGDRVEGVWRVAARGPGS